MNKHVLSICLIFFSSLILAAEKDNKLYKLCIGDRYNSYESYVSLSFKNPESMWIVPGWIEQSDFFGLIKVKTAVANATKTMVSENYELLISKDEESDDLCSFLDAIQKAKANNDEHCFILNTSKDKRNDCQGVFFKIDLKKVPVEKILKNLRPNHWELFLKTIVPVALFSGVLLWVFLFRK